MKPAILTVRAALLAFVLVAWLAWPMAQYAAGAEPTQSPPAAGASRDAVDLLVVPEGDAIWAALAAPVARRLSTAGGAPILLAAPSTASPETKLFVRQLKPRRCLVLKTAETANPFAELNEIQAEVVTLNQSTAWAGLEMAKRFWGEPKEAVLVQSTDLPGVIYASALAAHMNAPLLCLEPGADARKINERLDELKVQRVVFVASSRPAAAEWTEQPLRKLDVLDLKQAAERLVRTIGPQQISNVIVARAPNPGGDSPGPAWLAPYLSLARNAAVVVCQSEDGRRVEAEVLAFVKAHGLKPRTITLLGDYQTIGVINLSDRETLGEYTVEIEPCSGPIGGGVAAYGVGRIPQTSLPDASLLIARGIARKQIVGPHRPRVLMIANPQTEYGVLPFAETVSRVTAQESRNLRLSVDEFYGKPADSPEVVRASARAHLIVFEGHVTDQSLFQDPTPAPPLPEEDIPTDIGNTGEDLIDQAGDGPEPQAPQPSGESTPAEAGPQPAAESTIPEEGQAPPAPAAPPQALPPELGGLPLVILQSCHSLDQVVAGKVFGQGGVALLGTVTNVHSASGSSFVKAYCDGMLYRGQTVGEALRDARNYFICLARLKAQRGHKEQAKVYRVAMSFRLWADPEVEVLPSTPARARLAAVSARFVAADRVRITTPGRFLPECQTSKYVARMFPGSQAAGIVKRLKGKEQRRLMPTYFFVLPAPEGFTDGQYAKVQGEGDAAQRAVFMPDPAGRNVYLLYFPEKDKRRAEITLQFVK